MSASALISGCGSSAAGQLGVSITAVDEGAVAAGSTPSFRLSVVNRGTTALSGVNVRLDLPADFRYKDTRSIDAEGAARTQPTDPFENTRRPEWGLWSLQAPSRARNADGSERPRPHIDITFEARAQGRPGDYALVPTGRSESSDGETRGAPLAVHVEPSTRLTPSITALQGRVSPGGTIDYRIIVTNDGTGPATQVGLLITLPPAFSFESTQKLTGNSARNGAIDPVAGAVVPFYGGFVIPARSSAGPGLLSILFRARCVPAATAGTFTVSAQITDSGAEVITVNDTAPIVVNGPPPTAPPVPTPLRPSPPTKVTPAPRPAN